MKKSIAKKLRKISEIIGFNKSPQEQRKIYRRLKNTYKPSNIKK